MVIITWRIRIYLQTTTLFIISGLCTVTTSVERQTQNISASFSNFFY